jgi:immune inhibitor A
MPPTATAADTPHRRGILPAASRQVNVRAFIACLLGYLLAALLAARAADTAHAGAEPQPGPQRLRVVFLVAQFPDLPLGRPREYFTDPASRQGLVERLVDYYAEVSHGRLEIQPTIATDVLTVAQPQVRYVQRPAQLVRDAFRAFTASGADRAAQAAVETADALIVFFAGPGKESDLHGAANDPWSNFTGIEPPIETPSGHRIQKGCVIAAEQREGLSSFGVLCHEFGHLLGLPELYAPGGATHEGIGVWGLMGQGTWLGRGDRPPQVSAWCKLAMGWTEPELIERSGRVTLPAIDHSGKVIKLWARGPEHPAEYYLIENRQRRGADARLPGSGLLIWRVDERVEGVRSSQSDPEHMRLTLMQADGRDDLRVGHRAGGNRGDAGDPWRGMDGVRRRLLDAAAIVGVLLLATAALRPVRRRLLLAALGALGLAVGLGVSRSPTFVAPDPAAAVSGAAKTSPAFAIDGISAPGDPMSFTVTLRDGVRP